MKKFAMFVIMMIVATAALAGCAPAAAATPAAEDAAPAADATAAPADAAAETEAPAAAGDVAVSLVPEITADGADVIIRIGVQNNSADTFAATRSIQGSWALKDAKGINTAGGALVSFPESPAGQTTYFQRWDGRLAAGEYKYIVGAPGLGTTTVTFTVAFPTSGDQAEIQDLVVTTVAEYPAK